MTGRPWCRQRPVMLNLLHQMSRDQPSNVWRRSRAYRKKKTSLEVTLDTWLVCHQPWKTYIISLGWVQFNSNDFSHGTINRFSDWHHGKSIARTTEPSPFPSDCCLESLPSNMPKSVWACVFFLKSIGSLRSWENTVMLCCWDEVSLLQCDLRQNVERK